jgi:hypothetical protein
MPQVPPGAQELAEELNALFDAPEAFVAKMDSSFCTSWLPQLGHVTVGIKLELRTNFSNGCLHSLQMNS